MLDNFFEFVAKHSPKFLINSEFSKNFRNLFDFISDSSTGLLVDNKFSKELIMRSYCLFDKFEDYNKIKQNVNHLKNSENKHITLLGISNSGKTSYISALYYRMLAGKMGYSFSAKDRFTDKNLSDSMSKLRNSSLKKERFGVNTNSLNKYTFNLMYNFDDFVMSFDLYDYSGSILKEMQCGGKQYHNFKDNFYKSSCVLIFIDSSMFCNCDPEDIVDNIKFECATIFNNLFVDYVSSGNLFLPVSVVITKYDLISKLIPKDEICNIIKESFDPLFDTKKNKLIRIVSIIPISLGENISKKDYKGKLKPVDIYLPLFFALYFAFDKNDEYQNYHREKLKLELNKIPYLYKNGIECFFEDI